MRAGISNSIFKPTLLNLPGSLLAAFKAPNQASRKIPRWHLIVAREQTIVRNATGDRLGVFHGAIVDADLEIQALLLAEASDHAISISQLARHGDDAGDLVVQLAQPGPEREAVPTIQ